MTTPDSLGMWPLIVWIFLALGAMVGYATHGWLCQQRARALEQALRRVIQAGRYYLNEELDAAIEEAQELLKS